MLAVTAGRMARRTSGVFRDASVPGAVGMRVTVSTGRTMGTVGSGATVRTVGTRATVRTVSASRAMGTRGARIAGRVVATRGARSACGARITGGARGTRSARSCACRAGSANWIDKLYSEIGLYRPRLIV